MNQDFNLKYFMNSSEWDKFKILIDDLVKKGKKLEDSNQKSYISLIIHQGCLLRKIEAVADIYNYRKNEYVKKEAWAFAPQIFSIDGHYLYYYNNSFVLFNADEFLDLVRSDAKGLPVKLDDKKKWFWTNYFNQENIIYLNNKPPEANQEVLSMRSSFYYKNAQTFFIYFNNGFLVFDTHFFEESSYFIDSTKGYPFTDLNYENEITYFIYFYPYRNFFERLAITIPNRHLLINHLVWPVDIDINNFRLILRDKIDFKNYLLISFNEFSEDKKDMVDALKDLVSQILCLNIINIKQLILIVGDSNTGKSVIATMLLKLFGQVRLPKRSLVESVSFLSLVDRRNQKEVTKLQECFLAVDADVWFGTESPKALTGKFENIKKMVGGDNIEGLLSNNPYFARIRELPTCAVILLISNRLPIINDISGAMARRVEIIPAKHVFLKKGRGSVEGYNEEDIKNDFGFFLIMLFIVS